MPRASESTHTPPSALEHMFQTVQARAPPPPGLSPTGYTTVGCVTRQLSYTMAGLYADFVLDSSTTRRTARNPLRNTSPECHLGMAILRRGWAGAVAAVEAMAGLERNRFRTSDAFREAARGTLERHPEIGT